MLTGHYSSTIPLPVVSTPGIPITSTPNIPISAFPVTFRSAYAGYFPNTNYLDSPVAPPAQSEAAQLSHCELVSLCANSMAEWLWEEFYRRFDPRIRIYVRRSWRQRLANSKDLRINDEITADLTQNVYVRLLSDNRQALRDFKGLTNISFLAYLARIATNIVAEYFRTLLAGKRHGANLSVDYLLDERHISQNRTQQLIHEYLSADPESQYVGRLLMLEVKRLIKQNSQGQNRARDQQILELYFIEGLPVPKIAASLQPPLKLRSLESIIRRAQQRLFRQLQVPEKLTNTLLLSAWNNAAHTKSTAKSNVKYRANSSGEVKSNTPSTRQTANLFEHYHQLNNNFMNNLTDQLTNTLPDYFADDCPNDLTDNLAQGLSQALNNDLVTHWVN